MGAETSKKKTVLVCDDHATLLIMLKHLLSSKGFDVLTAGDGVEGLDLVKNEGPDLLLLDLQMPFSDGLSVLEGLKDAGKKPYTIVISGYEGEGKRKKASDLGAQEVWKKPFNVTELLSRIQTLKDQGII